MNEQLALLKAIRDDWEDDTIRLAYADYLDGLGCTTRTCRECDNEIISRINELMHGGFLGDGIGPNNTAKKLYTEFGIRLDGDEVWKMWRIGKSFGEPCPSCGGLDTSNRDRAEFIRLQCKIPSQPHTDTDLNRIQELYTRHKEQWNGGLSEHVAILYVRGMKVITSHLADVACDIVSRLQGRERPKDWVLDMCRLHPDIVELQFTNTQPANNRSDEYMLVRDETSYSTDSWCLPAPIFDLMGGYTVFYPREQTRRSAKTYTRLDTAKHSAYNAVVRWVHTFL